MLPFISDHQSTVIDQGREDREGARSFNKLVVRDYILLIKKFLPHQGRLLQPRYHQSNVL